MGHCVPIRILGSFHEPLILVSSYDNHGAGSQIRTDTNQGLNLIPLPVGLYQHDIYVSALYYM